jgi:hypothetical protein
MRLCPLEPCRPSCRVTPSMVAIARYAPRVPPDSFRVTRRGLPHPGRPCLAREPWPSPSPQARPRCDPSLTKLMSPRPLYFSAVTCSFRCIFLLLSHAAGDLFSRFNRAGDTGPGGREVACSRSLTGPHAGRPPPRDGDLFSRFNRAARVAGYRPKRIHVRINRVAGTYRRKFRPPSRAPLG